MAEVSMRDVAQAAGVSVKTVSNVLRGWPNVTPDTRRRVQDAVQVLGYRMNLSARALRSGRSGILALAVPSLASPHFAELTAELVRQASASGWAVLVDQTDADPERERRVVLGLGGRLIDGLIYSPFALSASDINTLRPPQVPMVLLGERVPEHAGDLVSIDYVAASRLMTEHLLTVDRRIAAIGVQTTATDDAGRLRVAGFDAALVSAGIDPKSVPRVAVSDYTRAEGARAMAELMAEPNRPHVVFCFNDLLALGASHQARVGGLHIPEDVAIAGFDDIEEARYSVPALTSIRPDRAGIAAAALAFMAERLAASTDDGDGREPLPAARRATPGFELIVRASTRGSPSE